MKQKRIASVVTALLLIFSFFLTASGVEYAYTANKSVKLRWNYRENSKYTLKVYNGIPTSHTGRPYVNNAIVMLNGQINQYRNNIHIKSSEYAGSNVRFSVPNPNSWDELNNKGVNGSVIATTIPRSTSGTFYYGYNTLPQSGTIYINFAMIWYNPDFHSDMAGANGNRTAMHEMLHVFGMGHYYGSSLTNGAASLTAYDAEQFRLMYP